MAQGLEGYLLGVFQLFAVGFVLLALVSLGSLGSR